MGAVSLPNYNVAHQSYVTTGFRRTCAILGVNGPKLAYFCLKFGGHFMDFAPRKTRFITSGMGVFARVRLMTGSRQAPATSLQF